MASSILLVGNSQLFAAINNNNGGSTKEKTECLLEMPSDCRIEFRVTPNHVSSTRTAKTEYTNTSEDAKLLTCGTNDQIFSENAEKNENDPCNEKKTTKSSCSSTFCTYVYIMVYVIKHVITIASMSCLFYVLYMYFNCNEKRGMIGKYYVDKSQCSVNVSCNILPWMVKHEETSCISYDSTNRTLKVHSPGSYQIHLSLTLMSHIGLRDKLILACIHTNKEEKCGRYEGRATQINIVFTVKLVDPSQTFWVAFQEWESIYNAKELNSLTITKF